MSQDMRWKGGGEKHEVSCIAAKGPGKSYRLAKEGEMNLETRESEKEIHLGQEEAGSSKKKPLNPTRGSGNHPPNLPKKGKRRLSMVVEQGGRTRNPDFQKNRGGRGLSPTLEEFHLLRRTIRFRRKGRRGVPGTMKGKERSLCVDWGVGRGREQGKNEPIGEESHRRWKDGEMEERAPDPRSRKRRVRLRATPSAGVGSKSDRVLWNRTAPRKRRKEIPMRGF